MVHPLLEKRLKENLPSTSSTKYLNHLKGVIFDDSLQKIDFDNAMLDLGDYFLFANEKYKNDTDIFVNDSLPVKHETIFSGFNANGRLIKCFSIRIDLSDRRYIKTIGLHYDKAKLLAGWRSSTIKEDDESGSHTEQLSNDTNEEDQVNDSQFPQFGINFHEQGQFFLGGEKNEPKLDNDLKTGNAK